MPEQKIKFKVSIKELSFEFEGSREVGQALQAGLNRSLGQLMDTQRTVMALPTNGVIVSPGATDPALDSEGRVTANGNSTQAHEEKAARKPRKNGPTLAALVRELKETGFFSQPRLMSDILEKLRVSGHNVKPNSIPGPLQIMAQNKELFRRKSEDGFVYKDTPFDEGSRNPNQPDESAD